MANKGAFYLFLIGTLSSLVLFLGLTWDTHRQVDALTNAEKLDDQVVAGKRVWEKKNCNNCHTILGFGVYYAPDLTRVYQRIGENGIRLVVMEPERVYADSFRKMPNLGLTEQEVADLTAFLEWTGNIDNNEWPPQDRPGKRAERRLSAGFTLSAGAAAFQTNCMNCHAIGGAGGSIGPAFDNLGDKYRAEEIFRYSRDPRSIDPDSLMMPVTGVAEEDLRAIGGFLAGQKGGGNGN
ncbi:MAG: cytochrome c [Thermoleophilia bacterium]|nr:cytochrome c [Thermoleophilia bacterium]